MADEDEEVDACSSELAPSEGEPFAAWREDLGARDRRRTAVSAFAAWGWIAALVLASAVTMTGTLVLGPWLSARGDFALDVASGLTALFVGGPLFVLRFVIGQRAIAREDAWARAQPFRLVGHPAVFGTPLTEGRFVVEIEYARPAPVEMPNAGFRQPARSVARAFDAPSDVERFRAIDARVHTTNKPRTRRIETTFDFGEGYRASNRHAVRWLHRLVAVLATIHAAHPIAEVRVLGYVT